ncbi:hypothetical protein [Sphingobium aromaticiconvertens]|uniref:hypothetical protein n=1 Tax=Sphingobium aromaticiconvertens TaxID=365341 RepID=UPI00301985E2
MIRTAWSTACLLTLTIPASHVCAKAKQPRTWQATRAADPITGATSCVVSALDYVGSTRYSRTGYLYPIIEMNSAQGLLIGVSSGGRFRLPTGTIVWRVDDRPFRELKAEDNPAGTGGTAIPPGSNDAVTKALADTTALTSRLILAATATSTLASGDKAREMLAELKSGKGLIYRASAAAASYGLPDSNIYRVGQYGKDGLAPIPIDASLLAALAVCGME